MINISYEDEGNGYLQTDLQISINLISFIHTLCMFLEALGVSDNAGNKLAQGKCLLWLRE